MALGFKEWDLEHSPFSNITKILWALEPLPNSIAHWSLAYTNWEPEVSPCSKNTKPGLRILLAQPDSNAH